MSLVSQIDEKLEEIKATQGKIDEQLLDLGDIWDNLRMTDEELLRIVNATATRLQQLSAGLAEKIAERQ